MRESARALERERVKRKARKLLTNRLVLSSDADIDRREES